MRPVAVALAVLVLCTGCSGGGSDGSNDAGGSSDAGSESPPATTTSSAPEPTTTPPSSTTPEPPPPAEADAVVHPVPPAQWQRMRAAGMIRPECPVTDRDQLRVVEVNHHTFSGQVRRGALVVNRDVAASAARIFTRIFEAGFPIRRMQPIEAYGGDDDASMRADNTSAFNCRQPDQNNAAFAESPHANGRAIDINPRENPWQDPRCGLCWEPTARYSARTPGPGKILSGGAVWHAFTDAGWIWQDIDTADYQHFDTGYPSVPWVGAGHRT